MRGAFIAEPKQSAPPIKAVFNYALACLLVISFFWASISMAGIALNFDFVWQYRERIIKGLLLTVGISAGSLVASLAIALPVAIGQGCRVLIVRYLCDLYVKVIRGTPLLAQIYLFYYIVGTAWGVNNRIAAGIIILSIFSGAYIAEILRGSIASIDQGQIEAAKAVGFTRLQTAKHVTIPQLVSRTLPALAGQFASIVKDSSLLSVIAIIELTQTMKEISATNFNLLGCYLFLGILYLCLTLPIAAISRHFEKRLDYAH